MIDIIKYTPLSLWAQKITDVQVCEIQLHESHIRIRYTFYADEPKDKEDLTLGWNNVFNFYDISQRKENIAGIEMGYSTTNKGWYICISVTGVANDTNIYVKKQSEIQEIYNKLYNYLFNEKESS